jgi:hypothetical protein
MLGTYPLRARLARLASLLDSLLNLLRVFAQSRCRGESRFRFGTGHCRMQGVRAKVNAAVPFDAAETGIGGDGGEEDPSESGAAFHANSWRIFDFTR